MIRPLPKLVSLAAVLSLLVLFGLALAELSDSTRAVPELDLSEAELALHLRFLASDELGGRGTGTEGNNTAARYIAEQFRYFGLSPAPGGKDYFQQVPLERVESPSEQSLELLGRSMKPETDFLLLAGDRFELSGPAIDAGFGLDGGSAEEGDLGGKVALVRYGDADGASGYRLWRQKRELLSQRNALAVVELYDGDQWQMFSRFMRGGRISLREESTTADGVPYILLRDPGGALIRRLEGGESATVRLAATERRWDLVDSKNVVGMLEGSDPRLRNEYVALTAHFDHLGSSPQGMGATGEDHIFNGARDNGMGTVALIAAAKALSQLRPARSVIFLAFTAEESGLLGSSYFVGHPVVPLEQTVFVLNNDGAGYEDTSLVTLLGFDRTSATGLIQDAARRVGLEAVSGDESVQRLFRQSDNIKFAEKGIPAITFSPGFRVFGEGLLRFYHRPGDEADEHFDFSYLHRFCQAYVLAARSIADLPEAPFWAEGDEYETAGRALFGLPPSGR